MNPSSLWYRASEKRIMTSDEVSGDKITSTDAGAYFVEIRETKIPAGIKPARSRLTLTIVFPANPTEQKAIDVAVAEIQKRTARGLGIEANVRIGDKEAKPSWLATRDANGKALGYFYKASDHTIYQGSAFNNGYKSVVIKKLP